MNPIKIIWAARALMYKLILKKIGLMSYIGRPCFIEGRKRISIGKKTRIFPGVRLEAIGKGEINIEDNCAIEQNVHIISKDKLLTIGKNTTISANAFISNVDHDYYDIDKSVMDQKLIVRETIIEEGCFIGFGSSILPGSHLGKHCIVGSNSVVKGCYPRNTVIAGNPAIIIKKYDDITNEWRSV